MNHNIQTGAPYALGWAALLWLYCAPYSAAAQSQGTHAAEAFATSSSTEVASFDTISTREASAARREPDSISRSRISDAAGSGAAGVSGSPSTRGADTFAAAESSSVASASAELAASHRSGSDNPAQQRPDNDELAQSTAGASPWSNSVVPTRVAESNRLAGSSAGRGSGGASAAMSRDAESGRQAAQRVRDGAAGVVNINSAGAAELERLPRIGPARAQSILALRTKLRQFSRVEQLLQVKGIGRATFRMLRPMLALSGPTTLEQKRGR